MPRLFLTLIVLALAACAQEPSAYTPFVITITPVTANVTSGDEIYVQLTIKNLTNQPADLNSGFDGQTGMDSVFVFEVTDIFGNPVPKRTYQHPEFRTGGSVVFRTLMPGETITESQTVSRLFDMRLPGKYTIRASGPFLGDTDANVMNSNKVTVTVSAGRLK